MRKFIVTPRIFGHHYPSRLFSSFEEAVSYVAANPPDPDVKLMITADGWDDEDDDELIASDVETEV